MIKLKVAAIVAREPCSRELRDWPLTFLGHQKVKGLILKADHDLQTTLSLTFADMLVAMLCSGISPDEWLMEFFVVEKAFDCLTNVFLREEEVSPLRIYVQEAEGFKHWGYFHPQDNE